MIAISDITLTQRIVPLLMAGIIAFVSIELIRRRKLREEYAMLWLLASVALVILAIFPKLLLWFSNVIGVYYITIMMIISFGFLSLLILHLAVTVSRTSDDIRKLAQKMALLEEKLKEKDKADD